MRFVLPVLAVAATALLAVAQNKEKAKDEDAIQGTWKIEKFDNGGGQGGPSKDDLETMRLIFKKDGKMEMAGGPGGEKMEGEYKLDPAAKVKAIDLVREGRTSPGIYELDGDTLRICIAEGKDAKRPTEMKPNEKGMPVVTLKRVKEEKKDK